MQIRFAQADVPSSILLKMCTFVSSVGVSMFVMKPAKSAFWTQLMECLSAPSAECVLTNWMSTGR